MVALLLQTVFRSVTVTQCAICNSVHKMIRRSSILAKYMYLVGAQVLENGAEFKAERRTLGSHRVIGRLEREDSILGGVLLLGGLPVSPHSRSGWMETC